MSPAIPAPTTAVAAAAPPVDDEVVEAAAPPAVELAPVFDAVDPPAPPTAPPVPVAVIMLDTAPDLVVLEFLNMVALLAAMVRL